MLDYTGGWHRRTQKTAVQMKMREKFKGLVWLNHESTELGLYFSKHVFIKVKIALSYIRALSLMTALYKLINCQLSN